MPSSLLPFLAIFVDDLGGGAPQSLNPPIVESVNPAILWLPIGIALIAAIVHVFRNYSFSWTTPRGIKNPGCVHRGIYR